MRIQQSNSIAVALAACLVGILVIPTVAREALDAQLTISPERIFFPEFTRPNTTKNYTLDLTNIGNTPLTFTGLTGSEDSAKGPGAPTSVWLSFSGLPGTLDPDETKQMTLTLNCDAISQSGTVLFGHLRFSFTTPATDIDYPIQFTVADTIVVPMWDTISSSVVDLTVGTNGNMGQNGIGYVNMDFAGSPAECDTGLNSRGNAAIYLKDASPVIIRKPSPGVYRGSWSLYNDSYASPHGFKPIWGAGYASHGFFSDATYEGFHSGTFLTVDSLVKCEMTWYAPLHPDSGNFMVQKLMIFPANISLPVTNLQIGLYADFDLPSDSGGNFNVGGSDAARRMSWLRGFNSADGQTDCADNSKRYAGTSLITWFTKDKGCYDSIYSTKTVATQDMLYPSGSLRPDSLSATMHIAGYASDPRVTDQAILMTLKDGPNGFTLPANDTLFIYSSMCVVRDAATTIAGLDSLKRTADKAKNWTKENLGICACSECCSGTTGNVNYVGTTDLSDLSSLVSYLTGGGYIIYCLDEANINASGVIDLADLSLLICYLTGGGCSLPSCPFVPMLKLGC